MGVVFLAVTLFVFVLIRWMNNLNTPERRRVKEVIGHSPAKAPGMNRYAKALDGAAPYIVPKESKELSDTLKQLHYAGYTHPNAPAVYYGVKSIMGLIFGLATFLYMNYLSTWTGWETLFGTAAGAFFGMLIPSKILDIKVSKRHDVLRKGFPDALDLLVVSVEAGLGFNAALDRVAKEIAISHPQLAEELSVVNDEIRAGIDRAQALRNLYTRTGLEDIQGLTTLIAQSLRFGTSIADSLRVYSEDYRDRRMQQAEERAALIGTKLIFPLVLCLFPSFFLVMTGPAILGVLTVLGK